jgi:parallel beta-helix repeat protein
MRDRIVAVWVIFAILFGFCMIIIDTAPPAQGITITVDDDGPADYSTIQEAISNADDGDTIFVNNGTYYENLIINKAVTLQGEDHNNTIIYGSGIQDVIRITSNWTNVSGFTVRGSGTEIDDTGIRLTNVNNCWIYECNIFYNENGIYADTCSYINISFNNVSSNGWKGVTLTNSYFNSVLNNTMFDNSFNSIYIYDSYMNDIFGNTISANGNEGIEVASSVFNNIGYNNVTNNRYGIYLGGGGGNSIHNNTFSHNIENGVYLLFSNDNLIEQNNISHNGKNGVYFYYSFDNLLNNNTLFLNSDGIYLSSSYDNHLENNTILYSELGIMLEDSSGCILSNNSLFDCSIVISSEFLDGWNMHSITDSNTLNGEPIYYWKDQIGGSIPLGAGQIIIANCTNIKIENYILVNGSHGIQLGFSDNNTLEFNEISNITYGIHLSSSINNSIQNNSIAENTIGITIASDSNKNNIHNNNFSSNLQYGIEISDSDSNTIVNNSIGPGNVNGIGILNSLYNKIIGNNISSLQEGIYLEGSVDNIITENHISNNDRGIYLWGSSNFNLINNNSITENDFGIKILNCIGNQIIYNNVSNNSGRGIVIESSSFNQIYSNNFINSFVLASDDSNNNIWYSVYPGGGNFWSTYSGSDDFFGPDQDIPGSDGIGDSAFILGNLRDEYPLMVQFEHFTPLQDDIPPNIFDVSVENITDHEATIVWSTDEYATSRMRWSQYSDLTFSSSVYDPSYTQNHSFTITSLSYDKTYYFEVTSVDAFGNPTLDNNGTNYYRFTTLPKDLDPPTVDDVHTFPLRPEVGTPTTIFANITDINGVSDVFIRILNPYGGYHSSGDMTYYGQGNLYYYNSTFTMSGNYSVRINAYDTNDNYLYYFEHFQIWDFTPPTIENVSVIPSEKIINNDIKFYAEVSDNQQIDSVFINITGLGGEYSFNSSMYYNYQFRNYTTTLSFFIPGNYSYVIWASDTSDNWNSTLPQVLHFEILDDHKPPVIMAMDHDEWYELNEWVTIEALITDNVAVYMAWVEVFLPGASEPFNNSMSGNFYNLYHISARYTNIGRYNYTIWATDKRGNLVFVNSSFTIEDNTHPQAEAQIQGQTNVYAQGIEVTFDGTRSWDNHRIENFTWSFFYDGEEVLLYGAFPTFVFVSPSNYRVELTVRDPSGNTATDSMNVRVIEVDNDNDGLSDYDEEHIYKTDPDKKDTDGDGLEDGDEVEQGTDPTKYDIIYWWLFVIEVLIVVLLLYFGRKVSQKQKAKKEEMETERKSDSEKEESTPETTQSMTNQYPPPPEEYLEE